MRRNRRAWATLAALVLTVGSIGASPTAAHAGGDHGGGSGSSSCGVYPIAATSSVLSKARVGSVVSDLTVGTPSGHEGWLTWTGDVSEPALAKSLTPPGDSGRYVNPDDPTDRLLSLGDFVGGKPGVVASHAVRTALGKLIGKRIVVPTWDSTRGTGSKLAYHVNGFASVELTSYDLRAGTRISAKYFGPSTCASPKEAPVAKPASATTAEDQPVTISLTGTSKDSSSDLTFRLSAPAHGAVSVVGAPSCRRDDDEKSPKVWWPSFVAYGSGGGDRKGHGAPGHDDDDDGVTCTVDASYVPTADYNGSDQFTFTVSADKVTSTPATVTITVTEVNDPPIAGADSAAAGSEPLKLGVATLLANDTPGPANEAGQTLTVTAVNAGADTHGTVTLADGTVTYVAAPGFAGVATFTYRVCDNGTTAGRPDPRCADGVVSVTVAPPANQPPVADPQTVQAVEDTALPITLTGSDPDGDALTFTVVSGPSHGTLSGTAPQLTYTPAPDYFGPDEFSFTVSDSRATSTPAKVSITVSEVNDPPVPGADSASGTAGQTVTLTVAALLANDVPGPANEADQLLDIESVDGGPGTHGTVVLDAGTITYTPEPGFSGSASFTYSVCDNGTTAGAPDRRCANGTVTVQLNGVNQPPVANDGTIAAVEDTPVHVTLTGSDPDGDPLVFAVTNPGSGTLSGTGADLIYTPAANFFGPDSFTFTVSDGRATSVPATVSITVSEVNDPPVVGTDSLPAPGHQPSTITAASLLLNDVPGPSNESTQTPAVAAVHAGPDTHGTVTLTRGTVTYIPDAGYAGPAAFADTVCDNGTTAGLPDPLCVDGVVTLTVTPAVNGQPIGIPASLDAVEDTPLPISLTGDDADGDPLVFTVVSTPSHGALSGTAPELTYTPAPDYFGADQFSFTVFDGLATSVPVVVSIAVSEVNDPPISGNDAVVVGSDHPSTLDPATLLINDVAGPANEAGQILAVTAVAGDADTHGSVTLNGGVITYTPDAGFTGTASFGYTVCDNGTTGSHPDPRCATGGKVSVDVVAPDQPPVADPQNLTVAEDHPLPLVLTGSDPEGRALTFAIAAAPAHGTLSGTAPALTYTPAIDYFGPDSFTFTTNDGATSSLAATVTITVTEVNDPPRIGADEFTLGGGGVLPPPPPAPPCGTPCGVIFGDPHLLTFDKAPYDAQAVGELIAAKSTTDDFEVQARFAAVPGSRTVSIDTALAMRVAGHRVTMYRTLTGLDTRLDGNLLTVPAFPQALPGGGTIGTYGLDGTVIVVWPDGSRAIVRAVGVFPEYYRFTLNLGLAPARLGHVAGLLGDANGTTTGELVTRGGVPVTYPNTPFAELYGTYVNSWRISNAESMFDYGAGQTTETFTDLTYPDAPVTPQTLPAAARASATATCNLFGLTTQQLLDACIVDVGTTGDADFASSSADAQQNGLGIPTNAGTTSLGAATTIVTTAPGENAVRTFAGPAGQKVTLTISANSYSGGADFTVRAPNGSTVASIFVTAPTGFRDVFTLPATGTYTFVVDPRDQQTGTATYVLGAVPDNTGTTSIGTATTVTTTVIGENPERTFPGTAGQKLTLTVSANSYSGGADFTVRAPNGSTVTSIFVSAATGFRDVFTLPTTGTYTFVVDPRDQQTGTATFVLGPVPDNTGTTSIGTATTVTTTVIGENAERTFAGTAGQKLTLTVSANSYSGGADFLVRAPSGSTVTSLFVSAATGFRDVFTLPTTGTYTMVVDPRDQQTGTATYVLGAVPDNTGTTSVGTATTVTTTVIGENAERTFPGTTGQRLTLTVSANSYSGGVDFIVRAPSGSTVTSLFVSAATGFRDVFTLPSTGTYTMVVDPRDQQTGTATFLLAAAPAGTGAAAPFLFSAAPAGTGAAASLTAAAARTGLVAARLASFAAPQSAVAAGASIAAAAAAAAPTLTITVAELLANDRPGPDNESAQTLTVTGVSASPFTHGTVSFAAGVVSYTPDADFIGNASFSYTVCDDGTTNGQPDPRCTTGSVTVKVTANHPPVIQPQTLTTSEDTPVGLTLTGSDPEGDPITFVVASTPGHGTLSGTPPALTYTPAPDFNGTDTFTYTANDGRDQSAPATVTVNVSAVNDPPVPQPDTVTARAGQTVTVPAANLTTNDAAGPFDERFQALTVTAVTPGANTHGAVALAAGTVTFTPDAGFSGTAVIGYTVCDNGTTDGVAAPLCADSTLSIVANRPPTANPQSAQTSLTKPVALALTATDPDGDTLTYAIAASPQHGTLTGSAPNVTYTAASGFVGGDSFTFTAADAYGASAPATVSITVADVPSPTLGADAATVQAGRSVLVDVLANDTPGSGTIAPATLAITAAPAKGTAVVDSGQARYTANAGTSGSDAFSYTVCDTGGGCGTAVVTMTITENRAPTATDDSYDIAAGATLHPLAPGVLGNDTDPDTGDKLQARLVRGVTNGRLLLYGTGAFTYTPNGPGIDTFVYHVVDSSGAVSNDATVTIYVTGPPGPPSAGNDLYQVQTGRELVVPAPGVMDDDFSPNPRLTLTALLQGDAAKGTLLLHGDGSFTYTPKAGYTGLDRFSYVVRDSQGRVSATANVGITVTAGGPPTATVAAISPAAGTVLTGPTHITATLAAPAGETVTTWTVSYRRPGDPAPTQLASGSGTALAADFDPTTVRDGTYDIVIRAVTSGGGILVSETGVSVDGRYKPGRYATTYRDVAANSANIPIDLLRTYDSINKTSGDLGVGWSLQLANFRVDTNGPLGSGTWTPFTCGAFPFLATWYTPSTPHFVTITWPDGHLERFRFEPNKGSSLVPTLTTAGFVAEPGTTSTLSALDDGLLLSGGDFLLGNFFFADGVYDPSGFVLTDKTGTKYTLDRRAGLLKIVDRNGNSVSIGSDGIDASSGLSMTFTRDAANRITRVSAPGGNIDYTYDAAGDLVGVSYPNGTTQSFTYDARHDLLTTSGGGQLLRTLHYDPSGRLTAITDGNGKTTAITIDVAGHQQVITDPTGALTTVNTYSNRGDVLQQDRVSGGRTITTHATYDAVGRQLTSTDGLGHTVSQTYDAAGNVLTTTDANGRTTTSTYNAFGQPLTMTDPLGHVTRNVYDARGNLVESDAPDGGVTTYTYDAHGNALTVKDPTGRVTTSTYDTTDHLASTTDPGGHTTHQTVDTHTGRIMSVTDPTGATSSFGYDAHGNLTRTTDANGHVHTATYDAFDHLTSLTDATGATSTTTYDPAGNVISVTDRNGQTTTFAYDANSRLVTKTVPGAGTTTYTYDGFGRRTTATNATAQLAYTYDDADHVLSVTSTPTTPGALPTTTFTSTFDAAGMVTSVQGPGGTTTYAYDADSRLTTLTDPAGGAFGFGYDAAGRQTSMTRPNGIADTIVHDLGGHLTSLHSTVGSTLMVQADYTYDATGMRDTFTTQTGTASYGYDAASQLTSATFPAGAGLPNEQYTYDPTGNRTSSATQSLGSSTFDSANRLLQDATATYQYDKEGNLVSRTVTASGATTTFSWTAEHHLLGITYPNGSTSTFRYDPAGRRVEIVDGATTTRYAFDGQAIAAEYDGASALVATYVHHPTSPTTTYEMTRGGQRYFYLTDALGSTTHLVTAGGAVANSYTYGAFGVPTQTGAVENPFTYTGQLFDRQAGLYLFPVRAYDPTLGRFIGEDPNPSANAYPYVKNNPTNSVDPSGASSTSETVIEDTAINPFAQTYIRGGGARIGTRCFFLVFETLAFAAFGSASWSLDPFLIDLIHQRAIQLCESI